LWLGEAKLYESLQHAKGAAYKSIEPFWSAEFLREMKALIGPKVELSNPCAEALTWLFAEETPLDQIISRIVIPVCLATDLDATRDANSRTEEYIQKICQELEGVRAYFTSRVPSTVSFVVILIPMDSKRKLETAFNNKVQSFL